jgi:Asp-tRNA(Asn)/Glu-tRNA(Gln) amidotransferase A subunit family amidase
MDFRPETVSDLAARVRAKDVSARELTQGALDRIDEVNGTVNAFVAVDGDAAMRDAAAVDELIAAGEDPGPLAGVPIGVKDLEDAAGFVTTYGSAAHVDDEPAQTDSLLVARLRAAGCVVVGKTNTPEFGFKADTVNGTFGATGNPWNLTRTAGGSSGGTAAALASGMVPLATGSDGGGSIRIPASACGLTGFKPSVGRVPVGGPVAPTWAHFSVRGPMARHIGDTVLALDAVVGPDPSDPRSLPMPSSNWLEGVSEAHPPRRVAWSPTLGYAPVDSEVRAACEGAVRRLESLGTEVVELDTCWPEDPAGAWFTVSAVGNFRKIEHLRGTEVWDRLDPGLVETALHGEGVTGAELMRAFDACHAHNYDLVKLFHEVNYLLTPTIAAQLPAIGEHGTIDGHTDLNWVRFTYPFNMTRSPAGTVCVGLSTDGLPIGLQVVGPQHADVGVMRLLSLLEDEIRFADTAPLT